MTDRMRALCSCVTLDAAQAGTLAVSIHTEGVGMKTFYRGLVPQGDGDPAARSLVRVHSKRLARVLTSCHTLPGQLIACTVCRSGRACVCVLLLSCAPLLSWGCC